MNSIPREINQSIARLVIAEANPTAATGRLRAHICDLAELYHVSAYEIEDRRQHMANLYRQTPSTKIPA